MYRVRRRSASEHIRLVDEGKERQRESKDIEPSDGVKKVCDVERKWVNVRSDKWLIVEICVKGMSARERKGRKVRYHM